MLTLSSHRLYVPPVEGSPSRDGWQDHPRSQQAVVIAIIIAAVTGVIVAYPVARDSLRPGPNTLPPTPFLSDGQGPITGSRPSSTTVDRLTTIDRFKQVMSVGQMELSRSGRQ